jgi:hypothetical protein
MSSPLVPEEMRQRIFARLESGEDVKANEIKATVSIAIRNAKAAAKIAAVEEKLSAAAKNRRKAAREKELADRERRNAEFEQHRQRQREATEKAAALIIQKVGPDIVALRALLEDAWAIEIIEEIKTPGSLKKRDAERERRYG